MKKRSVGNQKALLFEVVVTQDPREPGPYKFTVDVPALPGCFSEGRTHEEAVTNIREAISLMLAVKNARRRRASELVEVAV